jgi:CheY-like chemotaxis protein
LPEGDLPKLPMHKSPSSAVSPSVPRKPGTLHILVADDEENVRDFTSKLLGLKGHEVEAAADGQEALDLFMKNPQSWELVVLDAYMPRLGGLEAYLRMQMVKPDLPVIFVSGYVRGASRKALLSACPGRVQMLQKPFTPEELQQAVEESINPKPAPVIEDQDI